MGSRRTIKALIASAMLCALCGSGADAASQIYKNNVQTASHVELKGTRVMIVPPRDSSPMARERGFEIRERGIKIEVESVGAPYAEAAKTLSQEELKKRGIELKSTTQVMLNGAPALLAEGEVGDGGAALVLALGDSRESAVLYAVYPVRDAASDRLVRNSLLSVIFAPPKRVAEDRELYELQVAGTDFEYDGETNYTRRYRNKKDEPAEFSSTVIFRNVAPQDRHKFAEDAVSDALGRREHTLTSVRSVSYAGMQGIEITADYDAGVRHARTSTGARVKRSVPGELYQLVLFGQPGTQRGVFIMRGTASMNNDRYITQFRRIAGSIRLTPPPIR